jgi:hypothetical protein
MKCLLVTTLFFALQISGVARVHAATGKQQASKTSQTGVNQSTRHDQLIAETGAEVNLPTLQVTVQAAAFLSSVYLVKHEKGLSLFAGNLSNVPQARFYRLILFPFHGFW